MTNKNKINSILDMMDDLQENLLATNPSGSNDEC